ncbi:MAG: hypothetical protein HY951_12835 [Bacteroidia bacterium]|nr:hypothetical protein [Bacteroidia bacterium]
MHYFLCTGLTLEVSAGKITIESFSSRILCTGSRSSMILGVTLLLQDNTITNNISRSEVNLKYFINNS